MNLEIAGPRNELDGETDDSPAEVDPMADRLQRWFRRPNQEQLMRELNLRVEERGRERARIARELHDTVLQGFLGAMLQLHDAVDRVPADSPTKPSLSRALCLIQRVLEEGRVALQGLRCSGIASISLEQALCGIQDEFVSTGARFRILVNGEPKPLKPAVQEQISLIGREALVNAMRHSKATSIEAEVEYLPRRLRVVVRDNGCGIDPQVVQFGRDAHWGLIGMRERAESIGAQFRIWSRPGAGTEVEISIPIHMVAEACA
jgi:signal transduction histidine kinase